MAVILITHDLGVVAETCDRVNVMYCGRIVEEAPSRALPGAQHPYTRGLIDSIPDLGRLPRGRGRPGSPQAALRHPGGPDIHNLPAGCRFADRACSSDLPPGDPRPDEIWAGAARLATPLLEAGQHAPAAADA